MNEKYDEEDQRIELWTFKDQYINRKCTADCILTLLNFQISAFDTKVDRIVSTEVRSIFLFSKLIYSVMSEQKVGILSEKVNKVAFLS